MKKLRCILPPSGSRLTEISAGNIVSSVRRHSAWISTNRLFSSDPRIVSSSPRSAPHSQSSTFFLHNSARVLAKNCSARTFAPVIIPCGSVMNTAS